MGGVPVSRVTRVRGSINPWTSVGFLALLSSGAAVASVLTAPAHESVSAPSTAPSSTTTPGVTTSCSVAPSSPSITLSDLSPTPTITVQVGQELLVMVPPWRFGNATNVVVGRLGLLSTQCSVLLADHGRRTVLLAIGAGESSLSATITPPTDALMPAWTGDVTVKAGT